MEIRNHENLKGLTYRSRDEMAGILQTIFSNFLEWKTLLFDSNYTRMCFQGFNKQNTSIGSDNVLPLIRRQAIIWTSDGIQASLGLYKLKRIRCLEIFIQPLSWWPLKFVSECDNAREKELIINDTSIEFTISIYLFIKPSLLQFNLCHEESLYICIYIYICICIYTYTLPYIPVLCISGMCCFPRCTGYCKRHTVSTNSALNSTRHTLATYRLAIYTKPILVSTLHWRHNERAGVSNHQPHDCLLNRLFRRRSKKSSKLRVTDPLCGEFTGSRWIPRTKASDEENVSIWWRHHE